MIRITLDNWRFTDHGDPDIQGASLLGTIVSSSTDTIYGECKIYINDILEMYNYEIEYVDGINKIVKCKDGETDDLILIKLLNMETTHGRS